MSVFDLMLSVWWRRVKRQRLYSWPAPQKSMVLPSYTPPSPSTCTGQSPC